MRFKSGACFYCDRAFQKPTKSQVRHGNLKGLNPTNEHVIPQSMMHMIPVDADAACDQRGSSVLLLQQPEGQ